MNFFNTFYETAIKLPNQKALVIPNYSQLESSEYKEVTYQELLDQIRLVKQSLKGRYKLERGQKVILLFPLSEEFFATFFALSSLGIIVVLPNAKGGLKGILQTVSDVKPAAIITTTKFQIVSLCLPTTWSIKKINIQQLKKSFLGKVPCFVEEMNKDDVALITFTSGSSGKPKGVVRTHQTLIEQHRALRKEFPKISNQVDLTGFPVVTLHNLCLGATTILPRVNFKEVANVNPQFLVDQMGKFEINTFCAAPAYSTKLIEFAKDKNIPLKAYAIGGAPVSKQLLAKAQTSFPSAQGFVIYGSSEAEPISVATFDQAMLSKELGYCVGTISDDVTLKVIDHTKVENYQGQFINIDNLSFTKGEIIVKGKHVCTQYYNNEKAFLKNKLRDQEGDIWHRTGDLGFISDQQQLVLVGRRENLFFLDNQAIYHYEVECFVNETFGLEQSALVSVNQNVFLVVSTKNINKKDIQTSIKSRFNLNINQIIFIHQFPVDSRHNSKIDYLQLKEILANEK